MRIEEETKLDTLVSEVPVGGVFKPISGKTLMKIIPEKGIRAVDLSTGVVYNLLPDAKVEYFAEATVILKH